MESTVAGLIKPESCHPRARGSSLAVLTVGKSGITVCVEETAASLPKNDNNELDSLKLLAELPGHRRCEAAGHRLAGEILRRANEPVPCPSMSRG